VARAHEPQIFKVNFLFPSPLLTGAVKF